VDINVEDLLTVSGKKYIVLEMLNYQGIEYVFVSKVNDDDSVTDEFYIFEIVGNGVSIVVDEDLKNVLILKFQDLLKRDLIKLMQ